MTAQAIRNAENPHEAPAPLTHLRQLEAESIHILREVAAEFEKPVMLYSIGKDSSVMLHLARKAFYPGKIPFPLLHVDTTWKFREMIEFRDRMAREHGFELLLHTNEEGVRAGDQPLHPRQRPVHRRDEDRGAQAGPGQVQVRRRLRRGAPRRGEKSGPRSASSPSAPRPTAGTRRASAPSCGTSTTPGSSPARASAPFPCPTGPSSTSGSTSPWSRSPSCRSTTPRCGRWSSATAC